MIGTISGKTFSQFCRFPWTINIMCLSKPISTQLNWLVNITYTSPRNVIQYKNHEEINRVNLLNKIYNILPDVGELTNLTWNFKKMQVPSLVFKVISVLILTCFFTISSLISINYPSKRADIWLQKYLYDVYSRRHTSRTTKL